MLTIYLLILYISIIVVIILSIVAIQQNQRNYPKRYLSFQTCPFSKMEYYVMEKHGKHPKDIEGLLSYSLYGNYEKYSKTLFKSLQVIPTLLPKWYPRIYVAVDIPKEILEKLLSYGAEVYVMGPNKQIGYEASLWRYGPLGELLPFASLDADDEFNMQDSINIKKWMASGKPFASFSRIGFLLMVAAGKFAARPINNQPIIPLIQEDINQYCEHWFGFDEAYLQSKLWPLFKKHGYYQTYHYCLPELFLILIIGIVLLMIYTLYLSYN